MKEMRMAVDFILVLAEMWPLSRSIVTSKQFIDMVVIFEVKMMLLCCSLMLLIKQCKIYKR